MLQPTVLRSNAPPLREEPVQDGNVLHHASRILQEQSGNRQLNDYTSAAVANGYENKYVVATHLQTSPTENAWPATSVLTQPHQPQYLNVPAQAHYAQSYARQTSVYNTYRPRGFGHFADTEQQISHQARILWKRFQESDGYRKYRNRQQQHKDDRKTEEQKWPEHLEEAFFRALAAWPPMGRRKIRWKDKQRGRNELIADHIQEWTGEKRDRKQVSSHIQVLKPFVEHDPYIMRYMSKNDMGCHPHRSPSGFHHGFTGGRRASMYHAAAQAPATRHAARQSHSLQSDMSIVRHYKQQLDIFEPRSFSMFVQRKSALFNNEEQIDKLHTYTVQIINPLSADHHCRDQADFQAQYPQLAAMDHVKPLDCNVVVANASLAIPTASFKNTKGVELGISFVCGSLHLLSPATHVKCRSAFFQGGRRFEVDDDVKEFDVTFQRADDGRGVTASMKFGSSFWARMLQQLAAKLTAAKLHAGSDEERAAAGEEARREVSQAIGQISVIQEVVVLGQSEERILVMLWQFRHSTAATGRASWRKLVLPRSGSTDESVATASEYPELKTERVDSVYDYTMAPPYPEIPVSQASASQPALQSPFEYNESSIASASWPTTVSDSSLAHSQPVSTFDNNDFDFNGGNINIAFESNSLDYGTFDNTFDANGFDSTAFDFDTTGVEFAQDPALEQFTGQWYDASNNTNSYESQQAELPLSAVSHDANHGGLSQAQPGGESQLTSQSYSQHPGDESQLISQQSYTQQHGGESQMASQSYSQQEHESQQQQQQQYEPPNYAAPGDEGETQYAVSQEQQAFGGAGQDGFKDDALAALADASYLARSGGASERNAV